MKVIIAGSRTCSDINLIKEAVKESGFDITEVVCGDARGADNLGAQYAIQNKIPVRHFPAKWYVNKKYMKNAGYLRNKAMGVWAEAAIVVWDGISPGSEHMIKIMDQLKKPCYVKLF